MQRLLALVLAGFLYAGSAHATLNNGENASNVLGQADFTHNTAATTQSGMKSPMGIALDAINHRLFISDYGNNRVLVYNLNTDNSITGNGMNASNVLGQSSFTASTGATTQSGMKNPMGLAFDSANNRLFVADQTNNRVLVFDTSTITNGMNASAVLGQANFTSGGFMGVTQSTFDLPQDVAYDSANARLFVADSGLNRVMVFNTDVTSGLLGWWKFNDGSGTTAADSSGNGNTGTLTNGPTWITGQLGGAVNLDGTNDYVDVANPSNFNFNYNSPFTLTGWFYISNITNENDLISKEDAPNGYRGYALWIPGTNGAGGNGCGDGKCLLVDIQNDGSGAGIIVYTPSSSIAAGTWYHLAMTYDGSHLASGVKVYINGVSQTLTVTRNTLSTNTIQNTKHLQIGADGSASTCCVLNGKADDVRVYNRALSATEVQTIYLTAENAANVLGQAGYTTSTAATTQSGMSLPYGVAYDATYQRLFVADASNARVLVFNVAPGTISNGMNASKVLGQSSFTTSTQAATQSGMYTPGGLFYDANNNRLFSADAQCARVLTFNAGPSVISNGENASNVLGPSNFTTCFQTFSQSGFALTRGTAQQTPAVVYDPGSGRVFLADTSNNRVMIFEGSYMGSSYQWTPGYE